MVCVAFVIDVFARKIVGWRVSKSMKAGFVLDALNQAICQRVPPEAGLVNNSDRGGEYLSIKYTELLAEEGASTHQSGASVTDTTTPSPRASSACLRMRPSTSLALGNQPPRLNGKP